ncbi:membrane lipoprotein lipid attachment site-containing protein [Rossellomorea sp. SC111]|uniref:membrane lipoprotein lipid attachment site-containing protein n=1 Tax=Rossellomorea sp. SC111 TaxID=2968985 RepID=UPI00215B127F|nr:membrane lipoprotein lipid attachment site-containing protein [Rossellomorea sp. SC111]MCR8849246.1 membrane lipoprotein lipid attachment site-containing protein [Rossellomorea sp. SC111]
MKKMIMLAIALLILSGCKEKMPEPESFSFAKKVEAANRGQKPVSIKHMVQGNQVYIECIVPGVTFTSEKKGAKKGKIIVRSNTGNLYKEYHTAAFVIKGLPKGVHLLNVEIVGKNNQSFGMKEQFYVTIQ